MPTCQLYQGMGSLSMKSVTVASAPSMLIASIANTMLPRHRTCTGGSLVPRAIRAALRFSLYETGRLRRVHLRGHGPAAGRRCPRSAGVPRGA